MQQHSLLQTKLYIPPIRLELVSRPRLIERLNAGLHRKLTLISAPAGFGKTTLVNEWVQAMSGATSPTAVAWLSLDESDNDLTRFLAYLVAALQTIETSVGKGASSALQSPQPPPIETLLTILINEITAVPDRIVLVLDDYHLIEAQPIHDALTFLLEHLPLQMHLVIATREDPDLPLARLRVRGQLTEVRVADLRFTPSEAAEFLNQVMGLNLLAEDIAALETRTEGWIAGLQLAALSMQGHKDVTSFIESFAGSHRFVLDYLVEEVLQRQSESVQTFLLRTSILDRLCGPLCDAVLGRGAEEWRSAGETLEYLERANLFIVPLDDERRWYRYHHLFADLLRQRLCQSAASPTGDEGSDVAEYHSRASQWYEENGYEAEAFHHAVAAEDFERAASLAELAWPAMDNSFQSATWLGWVKALPDELIRTRPVLSVGYASALIDGGELEVGESRLRDAERWLDTTVDLSGQSESSSAGMAVVDEEVFRTLPARIATARAYHAQAQGDVPGTVKYARLALDLIPETDHLSHGGAAALLAIAYWAGGDLEAAYSTMADGINSIKKAGNILWAIVSAFGPAEIKVAQGRLHEAIRIYEQSLQLASEYDKPVLQLTANVHLGLGVIYHEQGDREAAARHLLRSRELGEQTSLVDWPYRWHLAQARLREARGELEAALDQLDEAKRLYVRVAVPDMRPIEALKARVYVRQGRLAKALAWTRERGLSVDDELSYLREFEHITLVRVLIAEYKSDRADRSILEAIGLLARLLKAAEEGGRMGSMIEILVLQALAHWAQGNIPLALAPLERALALAEPEGYVRIFVDEGPPMAALLREAAKHDTAPNYASQLLSAFGKAESKRPVTQFLIEPLSERELEVLKLLRTELSGPEIARELVVSLSTVRTHTRNIYSKLGVHNRRAAVRRAEELDLL